MFNEITIRKNEYYDSVFLMGINNRIMKEPEIITSAVLMGSDANKEVLKELGFSGPRIDQASANDLVICVSGSSKISCASALEKFARWLTEVKENRSEGDYHSLYDAIDQNPRANIVSISVPGEYAAHEARVCLESGLNVFLFSDNVSVDDEIALKQLASSKGLLVMGPDCGTSIIGRVGLGFANAVRQGPIGVIAAAGTGLQEFTCMVHNAGYGISHAIGTGGRDLSDKVGGMTTFAGLEILDKDKSTEVIVIVSKPPGINTLSLLMDRIRSLHKPVIGCFLGIAGVINGEGNNFQRAKTIDEAVDLAIRACGGVHAKISEHTPYVSGKKVSFAPGQKYLRGIMAGGTFCYQSQQILNVKGIKVFSNAPVDPAFTLKHPDQSVENSIIDMGDEYYMVGRPHPMIDGSQRAQRILKEAQQADVRVILLDFILGFNSSKDPVGELAEVIQSAQQIAARNDRHLEFVASICGTDLDEQDYGIQIRLLDDLGVKVFKSNASAVEYCSVILSEVNHA